MDLVVINLYFNEKKFLKLTKIMKIVKHKYLYELLKLQIQIVIDGWYTCY